MLKGGTWERWAVELVLGYGVKAGVAAAVVLVRLLPPPDPARPRPTWEAGERGFAVGRSLRTGSCSPPRGPEREGGAAGGEGLGGEWEFGR